MKDDYLFTLHWPRVLKIKWSVAEGGGGPLSFGDQFLVPQELVIFQLLLHDETTLYCPTWAVQPRA